MKWFFKKLRTAKKYEANLRSGMEIIKKRKEVHENYLTANRNKDKDNEARYRGWLEAITWLVQEVK